jgi:hypothetical protein
MDLISRESASATYLTISYNIIDTNEVLDGILTKLEDIKAVERETLPEYAYSVLESEMRTLISARNEQINKILKEV